MRFERSDPVWSALADLETEPSNEFHRLVAAAKLDPAVDFRGADLTNLPLRSADLSGFDFSGADIRGTGLRFAACTDGLIISNTKLDQADKIWWQNRVDSARKASNKEPYGFNEHTAVDLILSGKSIPSSWKPWIRRLDFSIDRRSAHPMPSPICDLSPLADLKNLSLLILPRSNVKDLTPLAKLTNLSWLWISNTEINDLSPLAGLLNLSTLWIAGTAVNDLSPLSNITNLSWLNISQTKIKDISHLSKISKLSWLNISYTPVKNLRPLAKLENLWMLKIIENDTKDFSPLRSLPYLKFVITNSIDQKEALESMLINKKIRIIVSSY